VRVRVVGQTATGYEQSAADCSDPGVQAHGANQCGCLEDALDGLAGAGCAQPPQGPPVQRRHPPQAQPPDQRRPQESAPRPPDAPPEPGHRHLPPPPALPAPLQHYSRGARRATLLAISCRSLMLLMSSAAFKGDFLLFSSVQLVYDRDNAD